MTTFGKAWRERAWARRDEVFDVVIIGGGIVGAGLFCEAARWGLDALLVEQHDFASGTSSRSGKMVHGGLRYLRHGQVALTLESVRERERLLRSAPGLVEAEDFHVACLEGDRPGPWLFHLGFAVYDVLAGRWHHRRFSPGELVERCALLAGAPLTAGFRFLDAVTDDARLVLRLLGEGLRHGGTALSYAKVEGLLRRASGEVCGVAVRGLAPEDAGRTAEVKARRVVNATGCWADQLRGLGGGAPKLRLLRGSHLVLPRARLPLSSPVFFLHPEDHRPLYALPWEGAVLLGTTDLDEPAEPATHPAPTPAELEYLLWAARRVFPSAGLALEDALSAFTGLRAVVASGKASPSQESREALVLEERGLLTVTGGKLTTFRPMAVAALRACGHRPPKSLPPPPAVPAGERRLLGRHGEDLPALLAAARDDERSSIEGLPARWAELRWAAREEGVVHLEDLLLRRVRLGLLLPRGGVDLLPRVRRIAQPELGWSDARWEQEEAAYRTLWEARYAPLRPLSSAKTSTE